MMMAYGVHPPLIAREGRPWSLRRLLEHAEVTEGSEFRALVANDHHALDDSYSLQVFVWPPGSRTRIHDHSSWGAYCCAIGSVLEERYERLDEGFRPDHARLKKAWQLSWSSEDGASTVLPGDGGIHRVGNPGEGTTISW